MPNRGRAFVAGGSGALGSAVCRLLLRDGYDVHATATSPDRIEGLSGLEKVNFLFGDLTDPSEAQRILDETGGALAVLVSTVGGYAGGRIADLDVGDIDRMIDLNLKTTALILQAAYPYLKESPSGASVVLVASRSAVDGGPGAAIYSAAKAAVLNLARSAAKEWEEDGIRVNAVLPSTMDTPANRKAMPDADFSRWPSTDAVAEVIAFLAGAGARTVSGAAIPVYGGSR